MAPPEHADGQPLDPAAARLGPDAEPLGAGVLCYQCTYDLAGLDAGGVCPECGLAIAASWPAWDLRACHRAYVERVRGELGAIRHVAGCWGILALSGAIVAWAQTMPGPWGMGEQVGAVGALVVFGSSIGMLASCAGLERRLRRDPNRAVLPGAATRKAVLVGAALLGAGTLAAVLVAPLASVASEDLGLLFAIVGATAWLSGGLIVHVYVLAYALQTLGRAGVRARRAMLEEAPGVLPLAGLALVPFAAFSVVHWAWVVAATLLGVALAAGGVALRCGRAQRVLDGLIAKPA
ncbi:MAG: hypothetical protein RIE32_09715 [Phycisphaerales bacterium]